MNLKMRDGLGLTEFDYKKIKIQQKIGNFLNRKCILPIYTLHFGYDRAIRLNRVKSDRRKWLDECYEFLAEDFIDFIKNYQFASTVDFSDHKCIWVCWFQGEKCMPDVVKLCIESVKGNAPDGAQVVIITSDNLKDYVEFPEFIYRRLKTGKLTMTHFSDLVRMALLRKYGGLWIDATVYVSSKIPEEYLEKELYSIQSYGKTERNRNPYYGGVTSFLVGGSPSCMMFDFCLSFFIEYQKKYGYLLDVHLINLCYRLAYEYFSEIRDKVDDIGVNNNHVQLLYKVINTPYSEEQWNCVTEKQIFHKLNWRINYKEEVDGLLTMYGYIKRVVYSNSLK